MNRKNASPPRVALAAQADGWWVRSLIIWAKPNPMPESVTDRPTDAYEHIIMLTKSERYYWDAEAVKEPLTESSNARYDASLNFGKENKRVNDETDSGRTGRMLRGELYKPNGRNLRNVWEFPTQPNGDYACECGTVFASRRGLPRRIVKDDEGNDRTETQCTHCLVWDRWQAHFATFPEEIPRRCILAASKAGDLVLDPFGGSGTTGRVAIELNRRAVLLDLAYTQDAYAPLAGERLREVQRDLF